MRRWFAVLVACLGLAGPALADDKVIVFAAASLKTALDAAADKFHAAGGPEVAISYGGSLGLARQLVAGAPADVFASADEASMDEAVKGAAIQTETRADLLDNRLVIVAPAASPLTTLALDPDSLARALGDGRRATGEVATVPVGKYARASLTKLGLWDVVEPKLAMTPDVRTALGFVARGEAALGIVYATDAAAEPKVKIVAALPDDSHPPIRYPFALTRGAKPGGAAFLAYLASPEAKALFAAQGFGFAGK